MERQSSNPGGAKENFFCCFWISSPRVSLCFSARAALKCLTVHFSMLIERSLLPTAQHFFHAAHKPSGAMQLPRGALLLCSLGQGPGLAPGDGGMRASLRDASCPDLISSEGKNQVLMALNSVITLSGLGVRELLPAGKLPWGQLKEIAEQRWCLGTRCPCRQSWHRVAGTGLPCHSLPSPWDISSTALDVLAWLSGSWGKARSTAASPSGLA